VAACYPLRVEVFEAAPEALEGWAPPARSGYDGSHGR